MSPTVHGYPLFAHVPKRLLRMSAIMPICNPNPAFLSHAVGSLEGNAYTNHKLVVKDKNNALGPFVAALPERLQNNMGWQKHNLVYLSGDDKNIIDAINFGMSAAAPDTDIYFLMCSDDALLPGALETVNKVFQGREDEPFWAYGITEAVDEDMKHLGFDGAPTTYEQLLLRNRIGSPSTFWNRRMLETVGWWNTRFAQAADYDYWLRCWEVRPPVFIDQPLGMFRHHAAQHSHRFAALAGSDSTTISEEHIAKYRANGYELRGWQP